MEKKDRKKIGIIVGICLLALVVICISSYLIGKKDNNGYRPSKRDEKVIPNEIAVSDENGNLFRIEEYDEKSRNAVIGDSGEIGLHPIRVYFVGNDGEKRLMEWHAYQYNNDGMVEKEVCYSDPDIYDDVQEEHAVYEEETEYRDGNVASIKDYYYDEAGNKSLASTCIYFYDNDGNLTKKEMWNESSLAYYEEITCNEHGSPVEIRQYNYDGTLAGVKECTYIEDGSIASYREYSGDKEYILTSVDYVYDSKDYLRSAVVTNYSYLEDGDVREGKEIYDIGYADTNKLGNLVKE